MSDFLDQAGELYRRDPGALGEGQEQFEDVFRALGEMQAIHAKSYLDLDNIEVLFGAIEMAQSIGKMAKRDEQGIARLRTSIITLISKTLELSIRFPVVGNKPIGPPPYQRFAAMLSGTKRNVNIVTPPEFSFLTFNYDLALDVAFEEYDFQYDYCLNADQRPGTSPFLKLHGSLNWGACEICDEVVPYYVNEAKHTIFPKKTNYVLYDMASKLALKTHCGKPLSSVPVLVPPTWNKGKYTDSLTHVWRKASSELGSAENIFVIGYSLPETDSFFRYLFALGSESPTRIRRFWVFNPDTNGDVEKRFRELVGRGIEGRFRYWPLRFSESLEHIQQALRQP